MWITQRVTRLAQGRSTRRSVGARFLSLVVAMILAAVTPHDSLWAQGGNSLYLPMARGGGQESSIIPNQYIVILQEVTALGDAPNALSVAEQANLLAAHYGGSVLYTYDAALLGFAATLSPEGAAALQADPAVAAVEPDRMVRITQDIPDATQLGATWGLDRIDQRTPPLNQRYTYTSTGSGVHVYIIDTGIRSSHSEFIGRVGAGFTTIGDGRGVQDCNGHGTHVSGMVAGTTYGVAKQATIHPVRTLGCTGSGPISGVILGVDWVTSNHVKPAVANMSLGGGLSASLDTAVRNSISKGVTYVVAAGNSSANACNYSPARVGEAITVGASTNTDARASFSNYGTCLDLFAPGASILSAGYASDSGSATYSGTSMATPHVAGAAALYLQANPAATPAQVATALTSASTTNRVTNAGTGSPNRLLYTLALQPNENGPTPPPPTEPPPPPEQCQELTVNGNFEAGNTAWQQSSSQGFQLICTQATCGSGLQPHGGTTLVWLGGGNSERSRVSQTLTIPAGKPAYLSYWYWIESEDYCGYDYGYAQLYANNALRTLKRYSLCSSGRTGGWVAQTIDVSSYAGQTVRLDFYSANDRSLISSLLIDDVSLRSGSGCTLGASGGMAPAAMEAPLDEIFSDPPQSTRAEQAPAGDAVWRR